jgi:hypothetical protein
MPAGARTDIPLFSLTSPGPSRTTVEDNRAHLHWDDLDSDTLTVRYYLVRDLYLFGGLLGLVVLLGLAGVAYYYRQIKRARAIREEVGLDMDQGDDDVGDGGPPPGFP